MKKSIKIFIATILALFLISINTVIFTNVHVKRVGNEKIITKIEDKYDCIIVLGAGVRKDGTPSPMLRDRLDKAIELYQEGIAPKIIMSGDHGQNRYDEVSVMKKYAIEHGIPSEDIFMDHAGFSTYESIYRERDVFEVQTAIIVTQKYHMYRALYIADKLGLKANGVIAEDIKYSGQSGRETREILARTKDFFKCIIKPKPTYLGKTIDITGNGDITND